MLYFVTDHFMCSIVCVSDCICWHRGEKNTMTYVNRKNYKPPPKYFIHTDNISLL